MGNRPPSRREFLKTAGAAVAASMSELVASI